MTKILRIGSRPDCGDIFCKIEVKDGRLSITGVEGPKRNGDAKGSCGQIDGTLRAYADEMQLAPQWNGDMFWKFLDIWDRWHLNDLRAGSPKQEAWVRQNPIPEKEYAYPKSHYEVASLKLAAVGLNPDGDYSYGHAWNTEPLPDDVVEWLSQLPDTDKTPAWV